MIRRRSFIGALVGGTGALALGIQSNRDRLSAAPLPTGVQLADINSGEDVFSYIRRVKGSFDDQLYKQITQEKLRVGI